MALLRNIAGAERLGLFSKFDSGTTTPITDTTIISLDTFSRTMQDLHFGEEIIQHPEDSTTMPIAEPVSDAGIEVVGPSISYFSDVPSTPTASLSDFSSAMQDIHNTDFGTVATETINVHPVTTDPVTGEPVFQDTTPTASTPLPAVNTGSLDLLPLIGLGASLGTAVFGEQFFEKRRKVVFVAALAALFYGLSEK